MTANAAPRPYRLSISTEMRVLLIFALLLTDLCCQPARAREDNLPLTSGALVSNVTERITYPLDSAVSKECLDLGSGMGGTAIVDLLEWIGRHTEYDISKALLDPPTVSFCEPGAVIAYEGKSFVVPDKLKAAYDEKRRQIFLVTPWSGSSSMDLSALLHELIHDVQFMNRTWSCQREAEWEAYKLQELWLAEQGEVSGFNWVQILISSRCHRDVHP